MFIDVNISNEFCEESGCWFQNVQLSMECIICSSLKPNIISGIFIFFHSSSVRAKNVWLITHNSIYELRMISSEIHWTTWLVAAAAAIMLSPLSRSPRSTHFNGVCLPSPNIECNIRTASYMLWWRFLNGKSMHLFEYEMWINKKPYTFNQK